MSFRSTAIAAAVLLASCGPAASSPDATATRVDGGRSDASAPAPDATAIDAETIGIDAETIGIDAASPPTCMPMPPDTCEATGGGRCYYLDPAAGDDETGDGSAGAPWRSFVHVNRSIYPSARTPRSVDLQPGDVVYLRSGVYSRIYHPGNDSGPEGGGSYLLHARGMNGEAGAPITFKAFPGHHPVLDPGGAGVAVLLLDSSHVRLEGIEVQNARDRGVLLEESQNIDLSRIVVHDTDGAEDDNIAGLEVLTSRDVTVQDSVFYDNYDRAAAAAGTQSPNSCNVVLFSNRGTIAFRRSVFYQTRPREGQESGCGLKYKHASPDPLSRFEISDSYFENHKYFAIGIGTAHAYVHHNVIVGADVGIDSRDFGGPTHQNDQVLEYNSIYGGPGLSVSPTLDWLEGPGGPWPGLSGNRFRGNIVYDTSETHHLEQRTILLAIYDSDALVNALHDGLSIDENCYFATPASVSFGFGEGPPGTLGGAYDLAEWRSTWAYDASSTIADPAFVDAARGDLSVPATSACFALGAHTEGHVPADRNLDPFPCD